MSGNARRSDCSPHTSMSYCIFPSDLKKGQQCQSCGYELRRDYEIAVYRKCKAQPDGHRPANASLLPTNRTDCLHIIEATGDSVEQKNCGCPGNKMTSVWECELFGRVAPFAKGDPVDGVRACQKCGAYEKPLPLAPPAE